MKSCGEIRQYFLDVHRKTDLIVKEFDIFSYLYLGFICSFFVFDTQFHRLYYYVLIIPVFLLFMRWELVGRIVLLPFWRFAAVYLCYLWMTQFWSTDPSVLAVLNQTRIVFMVLFFLTISLYLMSGNRDFPFNLLRCFAWAGAIAAAAAIAYHFLLASDPGPRLSGFGRAEHPILGAALYGVAALSLLCSVIPAMSSPLGKLVGWAAFLVLIAAMLLTQSRGPVMVMAFVILTFLLATGRWKLAALLLLPVGIYAALLWSGDIAPGRWITRGSTHRLDIWVHAWELISESAKSLLIGLGIQTDYAFSLSNGRFVKSPHNLLITNQLYGGVVATFLFIGLIYTAAAKAVQGFRRNGNFVVCALLLFGIGIGMFDFRTVLINVSQEWMFFWLPMMLAMAGWPYATDNNRAERDQASQSPFAFR
jgi:hypothetical protein